MSELDGSPAFYSILTGKFLQGSLSRSCRNASSCIHPLGSCDDVLRPQLRDDRVEMLDVEDFEIDRDRGEIGSRSLHRSEEHTSELQSHLNLVCRLLLE